jgi:hypothetical protein
MSTVEKAVEAILILKNKINHYHKKFIIIKMLVNQLPDSNIKNELLKELVDVKEISQVNRE